MRKIARDRPLRVLFVLPDLHVGGAERHLVTLSARLDRTRFEPSVLCIGEPGALFGSLADAGVAGTALRRTKRQAARALLGLVREMRRQRPDLVVTQAYNAEVLGRLAAVLAGVPRTAVWVHDSSGLQHRGWVRRFAERVLRPVTDGYIGVTRSQMTYLTDDLGHPERKIRIVHNGVRTEGYDVADGDRGTETARRLGLGTEDLVVGILAMLRPEKDHHTLLAAMRYVLDDAPQAMLLIVGDGPLRGDLERAAESSGIADRVVFAGVRDDVPELLRLMDVVALSSRNDCFPMALLEAMAAGRPVVASDIGGVPEIVDDGRTGFLVPAGDPALLAERLLKLLRQPDARQEMGRAARLRVEQEFSLEGSVSEAERTLERVTRSRRPVAVGRSAPSGRRKRILIVVENLPVPFDRRVWQESRALHAAGYEVVVVCPAGTSQHTAEDEEIDGIRILRYPLRAATGGPAGYLREYGTALGNSLRLALRVRSGGPVDAVHVCNPPDLLFLVALPLKLLGARFVFDHHDLVPELFSSRFPTGGRLLYRLTRVAERITFALADGVISTNESYRRVAVERGGVDPGRVQVVRSAPDLSRFAPRRPDPVLRAGRRHLAAYVGVMGPQDGVDYALRALAHLRFEIGRDDLHTVFMGDGDCREDLIALSRELGLADCVEFPGRVSDMFLQTCLSTADVCLSPDPHNPLNDASTMNKVVEYMAMGRPLVSFELTEARVSAGAAAVYAPANDERAFAERIDELLRDPQRRSEMGALGRRRVEEALSWETSRRDLLRFYDDLLSR